MEKSVYYTFVQRLVFLTVDLLSLVGLCYLLTVVMPGLGQAFGELPRALVVFTVAWFFVCHFLVKGELPLTWAGHLKWLALSLAKATMVHSVLLVLLAILLGTAPVSLTTSLQAYGLFALVTALNWSAHFYFKVKCGWLRQFKNNFVVVGAGHTVTPYYAFLVNKHLAGGNFLGFFDDNPEGSPYQALLLGGLQELKPFCLAHHVREIYFALPVGAHQQLFADISQFSEDNYLLFRLLPDLSHTLTDHYNVQQYEGLPVVTLRKEPLESTLNQFTKRAFDVVFSALVITLIFPWLFPLIALAIKATSRGPVFFRQVRAGWRQQPFVCFKFRTMYANGQSLAQATRHDPRVTRVGRFLRKTSLDELPQFFNVLLGDMSVVGPRPYIFKQTEEYARRFEHYPIRHFIMPGITGYAQVNGFRGEVRQMDMMAKRVQYDVRYVENWSILLDIKIVFLTVFNVFKGEENAY